MKDLYKTLGVAENADEAAIKKAYRKLAKEFHPDITGGDKKKTERFKEIAEAYDGPRRLEEASGVRPPQARAHPPRRDAGGVRRRDVRPDVRPLARGRRRRWRRDVGASSTSTTSSPACSAAAARRAAASIRGGSGRAPRAAATWKGRSRWRSSSPRSGGKRTIRTGSGAPSRCSIPPGVENGGRLRVPGQGGARAGAQGALPAISTSRSRSARSAPAAQRRPTSSSKCR